MIQYRIGTKLASRSHQINLTSKGWNCTTQDITSTSTVHDRTLASRRTFSGTGMVAASNATTDWVGTVSSCQFLASGDAQLLLAVASTPVILWWNCPLSQLEGDTPALKLAVVYQATKPEDNFLRMLNGKMDQRNLAEVGFKPAHHDKIASTMCGGKTDWKRW